MKQLANTVVVSVVFDEGHHMFCSLVDVQMLKVEPSKLRAPIDDCVGEVPVVSKSYKDMIDYWFLDVVECVEGYVGGT